MLESVMFFKHIKTYQISVCSWEKDIHTRKHFVLLLQPLINLCNLCSFCFFLMYLWDKGFRFYHFQQIMKNSHTVLICNRHWIVKLQSSLTVQSKSVRLGIDTKMTVQTPPHLTTKTQQQPLWASEQHSRLQLNKVWSAITNRATTTTTTINKNNFYLTRLNTMGLVTINMSMTTTTST